MNDMFKCIKCLKEYEMHDYHFRCRYCHYSDDIMSYQTNEKNIFGNTIYWNALRGYKFMETQYNKYAEKHLLRLIRRTINNETT